MNHSGWRRPATTTTARERTAKRVRTGGAIRPALQGSRATARVRSRAAWLGRRRVDHYTRRARNTPRARCEPAWPVVHVGARRRLAPAAGQSSIHRETFLERTVDSGPAVARRARARAHHRRLVARRNRSGRRTAGAGEPAARGARAGARPRRRTRGPRARTRRRAERGRIVHARVRPVLRGRRAADVRGRGPAAHPRPAPPPTS